MGVRERHNMSLMQLHLTVQAAKEIDGIEMGVLSDGTAYLSGRALARLCGVGSSSISDLTTDWQSGKRKTNLAKWLTSAKFARSSIFTETDGEGGTVYAYQEDVCNLVLEYYAFENPNEIAKANYRKLSRAGLRVFVYSSLGYQPTQALSASWRNFHDRLLLNNSPAGYFSVFKEISDVVLAAIGGGLNVDHHTVPDISVGQVWAKYWSSNNLEAKFGPRVHYPHFYPDYYPQAKKNPLEAYVYPNEALAEFRKWMRDAYLPERLR
jgi:hypothetical protein